MKKNALKTLMLACLTVAFLMAPVGGHNAMAASEGIAVVVNDEAITLSDVEDRIRLIIASSGMPDNSDIREKLRPQVINVLVDERLRLQEAATLGVTVEQADVEDGFGQLAKQNNMSADEFRNVLRRGGINVTTMYEQIRSQLAWTLVVKNKIHPMIEISDHEVDALVERQNTNIGKTEYLVSEIFLPVGTPSEEPDVRDFANRLTNELVSNKAPFTKVATQFSQSPGAARGGDIGWIQEGQLSDELNNTLAKMKVGEISRPVRSLSGFHILSLRQARTLTEENLMSRDDIRQSIGMQRLERLQRSYLMDLKSAAFIEERV